MYMYIHIYLYIFTYIYTYIIYIYIRTRTEENLFGSLNIKKSAGLPVDKFNPGGSVDARWRTHSEVCVFVCVCACVCVCVCVFNRVPTRQSSTLIS